MNMGNSCITFKFLQTLFAMSAFGFPVMGEHLVLSSANETRGNFFIRPSSSDEHGAVILYMYDVSSIRFNYTMECRNDHHKYILKSSPDDSFLVTFDSNDVIMDCNNRTEATFEITVNNAMQTTAASNTPEIQNIKRFVVHGNVIHNIDAKMIGRTSINFRLYEHDNNLDEMITKELLVVKIPVVIHRVLRPVDHAFQIVIYCFLVFTTLAFGCKLDLEVVKANMKKPIAPIIGMICQFVVMPMLGFGIAKIVTANRQDVALGIFVSSCCPGGGASNIYSFLLGGDLSLSITMTALSTVLALGMMPMWIYTLGQMFTDNSLTVPFVNIFTTLLILILPLLGGLFIQYKLPRVKKVLMKIIKPVTVVCVILLLVVGIYSNLYIFKLFEPRIVLAGCLLPYFGYVIGGVVSLIARLPWERVKTVAIETGMQNTGIAIILMMYAFPPPDGFIAAVAPIASAVMTPLPLFIITIPYLIYRRVNKEKYVTVPTDNEKPVDTKSLPIENEMEVKEDKSTVA